MTPRALALTGPTTSGKTSLGLALARRLGGEIVSMDSRQVYRGMDIGTDKVTPDERAGIPHFGLDLVDLRDEPDELDRLVLRAARPCAQRAQSEWLTKVHQTTC